MSHDAVALHVEGDLPHALFRCHVERGKRLGPDDTVPFKTVARLESDNGLNRLRVEPVASDPRAKISEHHEAAAQRGQCRRRLSRLQRAPALFKRERGQFPLAARSR